MWQRRTLARRRSRAALLAARRSTLRALALCCALPHSGRTSIPPARAGQVEVVARDGAQPQSRARPPRAAAVTRPPARQHERAGRPRGDVGVARPRGVAPPRRRRGRGRGGVRLAGRARRPGGRALARHLPRRALARPREPARHRLVEPAAPQGRRLSRELALRPVFLLAGLLLARLPAPARVLRRPDLLHPELPHAPGRRRARGRSPSPRPRRAPPSPPG